MLEAEAQGIASFQQLNDRFMAWTEQICNTRVHAETGQMPIRRFTSHGSLHAVEPSLLREAFRWSVMRRVTTTASVSLAGNRYAVDEALIGRRVELRFDPEDLTRLDVYWEGIRRVRRSRSSLDATSIARCRKLCHRLHQHRPASITSAWCWPPMTPKRSANSPSATWAFRTHTTADWMTSGAGAISLMRTSAMMRAPWATHFGFTKLPFSKNLSAKDLLDRASHQEAVARMRFCIAEALLGVITGEVGVGKTVAVRAAISQLDQAAHHIITWPTRPWAPAACT